MNLWEIVMDRVDGFLLIVLIFGIGAMSIGISGMMADAKIEM
jgi:hypothetical protein